MINYEGRWDRHIPLVEFVYNNNFQSSIGMTPYEALYGRVVLDGIERKESDWPRLDTRD